MAYCVTQYLLVDRVGGVTRVYCAGCGRQIAQGGNDAATVERAEMQISREFCCTWEDA